ncbi:MAG: DUF5672 family protein [Alistipes sp.]
MMEKVKIVMPIYSTAWTDVEWQSLQQTVKVLCRYPIVFLVPENMDVTAIDHAFSGHAILRVSEEWLGTKNGIAGYNRMMMSKAFYDLFAGTEYILICQTDAWIFRDELELWCDKGYDYIGAPFPKRPLYDLLPVRWYLALRRKMTKGLLRHNLMGRVYNGGLSLRRVASFRHACSTYESAMHSFLENDHHLYNEDVFWSLIPAEFAYPSVSEALAFSFDIKPDYCYQLTKGALPFGCHGWFKPSVYAFWEPIIK